MQKTAEELIGIAKGLTNSLNNVDQHESRILNDLTKNREDFRVVLWLITTGRVFTMKPDELRAEMERNAQVRASKI